MSINLHFILSKDFETLLNLDIQTVLNILITEKRVLVIFLILEALVVTLLLLFSNINNLKNNFMKKIPENINKIISEFITAIKDTFGDRVKKIILYGSYARGDFNTSSDIDIMILTDFTDDEIVQHRSEIVQLAYDIEWNNKFDIHLSPLVKNVDRFNYWLEALPFYMNVQKEGVVLSES